MLIDLLTAQRVLLNTSILELSLLILCVHLFIDNHRLRKHEIGLAWRNMEMSKSLNASFDRTHYCLAMWEKSMNKREELINLISQKDENLPNIKVDLKGVSDLLKDETNLEDRIGHQVREDSKS